MKPSNCAIFIFMSPNYFHTLFLWHRFSLKWSTINLCWYKCIYSVILLSYNTKYTFKYRKSQSSLPVEGPYCLLLLLFLHKLYWTQKQKVQPQPAPRPHPFKSLNHIFLYEDCREPSTGDFNVECKAEAWPPQRPAAFQPGGRGPRRHCGPLGLAVSPADRVQQSALSWDNIPAHSGEQPAFASVGKQGLFRLGTRWGL
jgi:hypothetical protein